MLVDQLISPSYKLYKMPKLAEQGGNYYERASQGHFPSACSTCRLEKTYVCLRLNASLVKCVGMSCKADINQR